MCYFIFRFALVYVRGKPGRKVPILMTPETVKAVEMLIETREQIGLSKTTNMSSLHLHGAPESSCEDLTA